MYPHVCKVVQVHADGSMTTQPLTQGGVTKREFFAAMAMQGMMADGKARDELAETEHCYEVHALHAIKMADALLRKLEESK